ncbi:KpsF/GutQ family sugar-phosphate isomerase [Phreatobacter sp. AB_2022a]|uniref:KpsF/GutQ family sugar-phosphate isomerase n=1 Tax=Phreatobacter sp. AB_2022a TaxID=3003134 RepID=UPI00228760D8|nr:KpsF/GutQ family sugar-phosphate isomerase [Phreatobacter sp. AB_2022a]MCZ0738630.1 KpsF/GutQ family sugar-phosphate isomerase [Phreatobacter sp. AB_2022a]
MKPVTNSILASALRTLSVEAAGIAALEAALANGLGEPFAAAVSLLRAAKGRVIVTGMGKSGHVGRKIAATLASTGTPAFFIHPGEASHGDLGMVTPDDVILALSWSGETVELRDMVAFSRRFGVGLVAVTSIGDSALGKAADVVLELPRAEEACPNGLAPTTSTLMQLALGDALAIALLEVRGFTAADFRTFHPGGKLGAVLTQARDVMHDGEALPLARVGAPMAGVILEMTTKGFGCCGILDADGRLVGMVTDGDLRRHMGPDLLSRPVDEVMSRSPKTVRPDQFASEIIDLLNRTKITAMFAVEDGRPIGILHVHDLLRAGVA